MIDRIQLSTTDGETLEARWDRAERPVGAVVLCHPHPQQGGTMMAPLMVAVTTRLVERGFSVLRFNFRGIGASTGKHDHGKAEVLDVAAAVKSARDTGLAIHLSGWSFGAGTALRWLGSQQDSVPYAGIAPSPEGLPDDLPPGPKRIVVGTRDQVVDVEGIRAYAERLSIDLLLTPGDHFFHGRGKKIGDLVAQGFELPSNPV
ncbi:MAG TPA: alpha/beta hydrolase [Acidimicrobiia bacterium]|nr:alpha/beta hydrolase [Acidimicrobiia bacterium]